MIVNFVPFPIVLAPYLFLQRCLHWSIPFSRSQFLDLKRIVIILLLDIVIDNTFILRSVFILYLLDQENSGGLGKLATRLRRRVAETNASSCPIPSRLKSTCRSLFSNYRVCTKHVLLLIYLLVLVYSYIITTVSDDSFSIYLCTAVISVATRTRVYTTRECHFRDRALDCNQHVWSVIISADCTRG